MKKPTKTKPTRAKRKGAKVTGKRVASAAGRLLATLKNRDGRVWLRTTKPSGGWNWRDITETIESILASALGQREKRGRKVGRK